MFRLSQSRMGKVWLGKCPRGGEGLRGQVVGGRGIYLGFLFSFGFSPLHEN